MSTNQTKNICLVHGWGSSVDKLLPLEKELKKLSWNVYTPKLPYFDLKEPSSPWSNQDFTNYVFKKANQKFKNHQYYLFGHSLGGRIAIKAATQKQSGLKGIILCSSAGISRDHLFKRLPFLVLSKIFSPIKKILPTDSRQSQFIQKIVPFITGNHDYSRIVSENKKQTFKKIISENQRDQVKKIKLKTLILWGAKDKITPLNDALFLRKNIKNSSIQIYPSANHTLPYTHYTQIAKQIDSWIK